jgi:hypothetical protein
MRVPTQRASPALPQRERICAAPSETALRCRPSSGAARYHAVRCRCPAHVRLRAIAGGGGSLNTHLFHLNEPVILGIFFHHELQAKARPPGGRRPAGLPQFLLLAHSHARAHARKHTRTHTHTNTHSLTLTHSLPHTALPVATGYVLSVATPLTGRSACAAQM